jgi:hypothetical protein
MKTHYKKIFVILLLFLVVGVGIYLQIVKRGGEKRVLPIPTPSINTEVKQKPIIELTLTEKDFQFPKNLPLLNKTKFSALDDSFAKQLGKRLGFDSEPIEAKDTRYGKIFIWNSTEASLIINPVLRKLSYYETSTSPLDYNSVVNKQLTDNDLILIASDFLINKVGLEKDDFEFANFIYFEQGENIEGLKQTSKEKAQVTQINFSPKFENLPILTQNPLESIIITQILKDGSIPVVEVTLLESINQGHTLYKLKGFEEFVNSLSQAKVVSLNDGNFNPEDLAKDAIKKAVIKKVTIAYLLDNIKNETLQPVYVLEGTATVIGFNQNVNIIMYLPAFSQSP